MTARSARATLVIAVVTVFAILLATTYMLSVPNPDDSNRYLSVGLEVTGAANRVSGIYLNLRLFDTLIEVLVFSVAVLGVRHYLRHSSDVSLPSLSESAVVRTGASILGPIALLLSAFFAVFGHLSPGGGFASGVIAASAVLYVAIAYGMPATEARLDPRHVASVEKAILMLILAWVLLPAALGRPPLSELLPTGTPGRFFSGGSILPYNLLIGTKVFLGAWLVVAAFAQHRGEL
jgi:multicomponent Na+:H+ antiporter subunit B